jgi:DNA topoisomerase-1
LNGCRTSFPLPAKGKITNMNKLCQVCNLPVISVQYIGKRSFEMCINHNCASKKDWGKKKEEKKEEKKE